MRLVVGRLKCFRNYFNQHIFNMATTSKKITIDGVEHLPTSEAMAKTNTDGLNPVIVRSYSAGVHFGYLKSLEYTLSGAIVTLVDTRRVYSWQGAATLSQMALDGVAKPEGCKFSVVLPENTIIGAIEIIPVSEKAWINLQNVAVWKI